MIRKISLLLNKVNFVRKSLEPFLVGIEPLASKIIKNRLIILYAHLYPDNDSPLDIGNITENLRYLNGECQVLPLPDALNRIFKGHELPPRAVSIIIDDATQSFYRVGRDLLSEADLPYTLAVIPGLIKAEGKEHLIARLMRIAGHPYWLSNQEMLDRTIAWFGEPSLNGTATFESVFSIASNTKYDELVKLLDHVRALDHDFMTWGELKDLQSEDKVNFASHTMSHPQLQYASGKWLDWELSRSKEMLEENLGVIVDSLVVPYGNHTHFSLNVEQALSKTGYKSAFLTEKGVFGSGMPQYRIPRLPLEDDSWRLHIHTCPAVCSLLYPGSNQRKRRKQQYLSI